MLFTPNGRFHLNSKICLSNSSFHPESWSPMWYISTFLIGFLSFMLETQHTLGALNTTDQEKKKLAAESRAYNRRNAKFRSVFPELLDHQKPKQVQKPKEVQKPKDVQKLPDNKKEIENKKPQKVNAGNNQKRALDDDVIVIEDGPSFVKKPKKNSVVDEVIIID